MIYLKSNVLNVLIIHFSVKLHITANNLIQIIVLEVGTRIQIGFVYVLESLLFGMDNSVLNVSCLDILILIIRHVLPVPKDISMILMYVSPQTVQLLKFFMCQSVVVFVLGIHPQQIMEVVSLVCQDKYIVILQKNVKIAQKILYLVRIIQIVFVLILVKYSRHKLIDVNVVMIDLFKIQKVFVLHVKDTLIR